MGRPTDNRPVSDHDDARDYRVHLHPVQSQIFNNRSRGETFFAPAGRSRRFELKQELQHVLDHPVVGALIRTAGGPLAVLNEHRQILIVNDAFLDVVGLDDAEHALGFRTGEVIRCVFSHEGPDGCGTSRVCSSCGAAKAIEESLGTDRAQENACVFTVEKNGETADVHFRVRAYPLSVDDRRIVVMFLADGESKRSFSRDIDGIATESTVGGGVSGEGNGGDPDGVAERMRMLTARLDDGKALRAMLTAAGNGEFQPDLRWVSVGSIIAELREIFAYHPASAERTLILRAPAAGTRIRTDFTMLVHVLCDMVVNALEATRGGGTVRMWIEEGQGSISFCVWNRSVIAPDAALRVFQRNFTTKPGEDRGRGTWTMKLLGQEYLGARVGFSTSISEGTVFRVKIPAGIAG